MIIPENPSCNAGKPGRTGNGTDARLGEIGVAHSVGDQSNWAWRSWQVRGSAVRNPGPQERLPYA